MSALFATSSCVLFGYILTVAMKKTVFKQIDMSAEDIEILERLGDPTWKTYLLSYFLMLFLIIDAVIIIVAMFKNGGSAASAYMVTAVPTLIIYALIGLEVMGDNKYVYDKDVFLVSIAFYAASHITLFLFALFSTEKKKVSCDK